MMRFWRRWPKPSMRFLRRCATLIALQRLLPLWLRERRHRQYELLHWRPLCAHWSHCCLDMQRTFLYIYFLFCWYLFFWFICLLFSPGCPLSLWCDWRWRVAEHHHRLARNTNVFLRYIHTIVPIYCDASCNVLCSAFVRRRDAPPADAALGQFLAAMLRRTVEPTAHPSSSSNRYSQTNSRDDSRNTVLHWWPIRERQ